jgi:hypothetical protein
MGRGEVRVLVICDHNAAAIRQLTPTLCLHVPASHPPRLPAAPRSREPNPYDYGSRRNWELVFGRHWRGWFWPAPAGVHREVDDATVGGTDYRACGVAVEGNSGGGGGGASPPPHGAAALSALPPPPVASRTGLQLAVFGRPGGGSGGGALTSSPPAGDGNVLAATADEEAGLVAGDGAGDGAVGAGSATAGTTTARFRSPPAPGGGSRLPWAGKRIITGR